jgi:hypothetical protein
MSSYLLQVFVVVFPFLFVMTLIGIMSTARKMNQVFRPRQILARLFLWLERTGLIECYEREQYEIVA